MKTYKQHWNTPLTDDELKRLGFVFLGTDKKMAYLPADIAKPMGLPENIEFKIFEGFGGNPTPAELFMNLADFVREQQKETVKFQIKRFAENL